ncbi:glycosyltransferase family protein [Paenibacillus selenitireducens]|nr:hypothetical protein [Paenibacillus selenitireducens]
MEWLNYEDSLPHMIQSEIDFLDKYEVSLIISDISPLAFEVGDAIGVQTMGVSNFTWYTAYKDLIPDEKLVSLENAYQKMDYFIALAGQQEENWGRKAKYDFLFYSRETNQVEVNRIRNEINPDNDKTIVFVGIGMGLHIDLSDNAFWNDEQCVFVVSNNLNVSRSNIHSIPKEYTESQNYIAASDVIVTKAGWGTLSEAINNNRRLVIIDRRSLNEDKNTITYVTKYYSNSRVISFGDLKSINFTVEYQMTKRNPEILDKNVVNDIAIKMIEIMDYSARSQVSSSTSEVLI